MSSASTISPARRKSILSSLSGIGSQPPSALMRVLPPHRILKSLAAAAVCMSAEQAGLAETLTMGNPNPIITNSPTKSNHIGYATNDKKTFKFPASMGIKSGMKLGTNGLNSALVFSQTGKSAGHFAFDVAKVGGHMTPFAAPVPYVKSKNFFKSVGTTTSHGDPNLVSVSGVQRPANFSSEYYLFKFQDAASVTHYGWIEGTLSNSNGGKPGVTFDLISYAWDSDTSGTQIFAGQTTPSPGGSGTAPEPSTGAMGAIAALILGAAGVRKWKKEQQA